MLTHGTLFGLDVRKKLPGQWLVCPGLGTLELGLESPRQRAGLGAAQFRPLQPGDPPREWLSGWESQGRRRSRSWRSGWRCLCLCLWPCPCRVMT